LFMTCDVHWADCCRVFSRWSLSPVSSNRFVTTRRASSSIATWSDRSKGTSGRARTTAPPRASWAIRSSASSASSAGSTSFRSWSKQTRTPSQNQRWCVILLLCWERLPALFPPICLAIAPNQLSPWSAASSLLSTPRFRLTCFVLNLLQTLFWRRVPFRERLICNACCHGRRKDFFQGERIVEFSRQAKNIFSGGGQKWWNLIFFRSKLKNNLFF